MANIQITTTNDTFFPVFFNKINNNFNELNEKKIEIENIILQQINELDSFLIIDSEDNEKVKNIEFKFITN